MLFDHLDLYGYPLFWDRESWLCHPPRGWLLVVWRDPLVSYSSANIASV